MNTRMDMSRFHIGAYLLQPYARTEKHIRDIRAAGIDFIACMDDDRPALDLFAKHGLGACVRGIVPDWFGGTGAHRGQMAVHNPLPAYTSAAKAFVDHPAIWAIDLGDEPSALDLPHYGQVAAAVEEAFPYQFGYLNLYANYGMVAENTPEKTAHQLGADSYEAYINEYCRHVPLAYICLDHYVYSTGNPEGLWENLRIAANAAWKYGKHLWFVAQVNSSREDAWLSENQLRFQAYSAMAYGAETIIWACYTAGWWHHQVLDSQGRKTEQYDKLKRINSEIAQIAAPYMRYQVLATHRVLPGEECSLGPFRQLRNEGDQPLLIGEMISRNGSQNRALFVFGAGDFQDAQPRASILRFSCGGTVKVHDAEGVRLLNHRENRQVRTLMIRSNQAALITVERAR